MNSRKFTVLFHLILIFAVIAIIPINCRAQGTTEQTPRIHRMESITIDPQTCTITWVVTSGELQDDKYTPAPGSEKTYKMDLHKAEMSIEGNVLKFSPEEAGGVHQNVREFIKYLASSTVWADERSKELKEKQALQPKQRASK